MNTNDLTIAEVNFIKNLLIGMTNEQIIADQTAKTSKEMYQAVDATLITLGYVKTSFRLTARTNTIRLALNGKQNREFQDELRKTYQSENLMQVMFCEDHCNAKEYRHAGEGLLPVEKNRPKSFTKVASQLVERGLLVQDYMMITIARGEGITDALIEIRNR
jgi:hypothetical protein